MLIKYISNIFIIEASISINQDLSANRYYENPSQQSKF